MFNEASPGTQSFLDFVIIANIFHGFVMLIYAKNLYHVLFDEVTVGAMGALPLFFYPGAPKVSWGIQTLSNSHQLVV